VIRVVLPHHLATLAGTGREVDVQIEVAATLREVLDALECSHPVLRGTIRDPETQTRRPFIRFYACEEDLSHQPPDDPLPPAVASGREAIYVVGAMAGG
jgi:sulfur-carrier protein